MPSGSANLRALRIAACFMLSSLLSSHSWGVGAGNTKYMGGHHSRDGLWCVIHTDNSPIPVGVFPRLGFLPSFP